MPPKLINNQIASTSRPIIHLHVKIKNTAYRLGTLRFNYNELSYFLIDPRQQSFPHLNLVTRKRTAPVEHITWHNTLISLKKARQRFASGSRIIRTSIVQPSHSHSPLHRVILFRYNPIFRNCRKTSCLERSDYTRDSLN